MFDQNQLPVSGGLLLSGLVYAGTCLFITGPLIATRTIENTPWQSACEAGVKAEIDATRTPPKVIPKTDCRSLVGGLFPQLTGLCAKYGNPDLEDRPPRFCGLRNAPGRHSKKNALRLSRTQVRRGVIVPRKLSFRTKPGRFMRAACGSIRRRLCGIYTPA